MLFLLRKLFHLVRFKLSKCKHEFTVQNWTDLNGDPRCMHCQDYFLSKIVKAQPGRYYHIQHVPEKETFVWVPKPF